MDFSKDLGIADEISRMNERLCELDRIRIETPVTVGTYALMDKFRIKCQAFRPWQGDANLLPHTERDNRNFQDVLSKICFDR